jgi:c-di-GMP-binding flagellar brake protein YcgR
MALFDIFSRKPSPRQPPAKSKSSKDTLSNPAKIIGLLQHLLDDRTLLTVRIPGVDNNFTSAVLAVDKKNKTFSLDEISPAEGHTLFLDKKELQVNGMSRGALFSFTLQLQKQGTSRDIAFYEFDIPESVKHIQRRAYYRVRLKADQRLSVTTLHKDSDTSISGFVIDLSSHGICVLFNTERHIQTGDILNLCKLRLPEGQIVTFDLDVRNVQTMPNERIRVGGSFINLNVNNVRLLEKFVLKLERESLRK